MQDWRSYAWLTFVGLMASCFRLPDLLRDNAGKVRWGMLLIQIPTAFTIAVVAHASAPAVMHFFPFAGDFVAEGITGIFAFAGPLVVTRIIDAFADRIRGGR